MTIGERIKQRRVDLGMSVDDLALKLGKNRATVYRYEKNDIESLPTTILEPLAKALKTTPGRLIGWPETVTPSESSSITADEITLLSDYRKLNEAGKNQALRQIADLTEIEKYTFKGDGSAGLRSDVG